MRLKLDKVLIYQLDDNNASNTLKKGFSYLKRKASIKLKTDLSSRLKRAYKLTKKAKELIDKSNANKEQDFSNIRVKREDV
jgi:hypothetical protein